MSITKITYADKQQLNANASINANNKCQATDMNEIKTVVNGNADNIGDLATLTTTATTDIVSALNVLAPNEIIASSLSAAAGYIKYSNGLMFQWKQVSATAGGTLWVNDIYYSDTSVGNWGQSFTTLFCTFVNSNSSLFWATNWGANTTSGGTIRFTRPNSGTANVVAYVFAIGQWR